VYALVKLLTRTMAEECGPVGAVSASRLSPGEPSPKPAVGPPQGRPETRGPIQEPVASAFLIA
jgi:hypothetical protein